MKQTGCQSLCNLLTWLQKKCLKLTKNVSFEFLKKEKNMPNFFTDFPMLKNETFCLIFKHGEVFLQLQSHINPVLHRLLGCILPTCQLCKSYFAEKQTSGNGSSASVTLHFLNHHHASGLRRVGLGTEEQRFLSVINCLQFCTGKPLYHTIWDPFFASTNPPLSVSME